MSDPRKERAVPNGAARAENHDAGSAGAGSGADVWPSLPYQAWKDTYETLHMWTQVVGKIRLALSPVVNHWWHVTLYVTPSGLTTSPIPYETRTVEIWFDFIDHNLTVPTPAGLSKARVRPDGAYYDSQMQEFFLLYDDVRNAADPGATLLDFLQTTYAAGADLAGWDRPSLER